MKQTWYWKVGIVLLAVAFAYFVWPGRYQYLPVGNRLVRVDRLTGQPEIMQSVEAHPLGRLTWVGHPASQRAYGDDEDPIETRLLRRRAEEQARDPASGTFADRLLARAEERAKAQPSP